MKLSRIIIAASALASVLSSCGTKEVTVSIVPNPTSVKAAGRGAELKDVPVFNCSAMELQLLGETFLEVAGKQQLPDFDLSTDPNLAPEEYILDSRKGSVKIIGGSEKGVWWGLQTALQIIYQSETRFPGLLITDKPVFAYRGVHFDCCRHFFTVDEVKKFIDMANLHKLNVLHWHLTEDQGWRAEIKRYPKLTEIGSVRAETLVGHYGSNKYDGTPYGGFYTQDEMRDIVAYAAARQVTVIPEIEVPGHASAALASYPELGCAGKGYKVQTTWGIFPEIMCAGNPKTLEFYKGVLDEICEIFPSEYIHLGGDEAPRDEWEKCPKCQALMKEKGYTSEAQLQSYLINSLEEYLNAKGRKIIGWDEILEGGVTKTANIMSWRGTEGGIAAAKQGNDVIMTPNSFFYFDYYQTKDPEANGEPLAIGGYLPLEKSYSFNPYEGLNDEQKSHIKGIQANMWTEYVPSYEHIEHMELPRMAALAEVCWSNENRTEYGVFVERVRTSLLPVYEARGYNYSDYAFQNPPVE